MGMLSLYGFNLFGDNWSLRFSVRQLWLPHFLFAPMFFYKNIKGEKK